MSDPSTSRSLRRRWIKRVSLAVLMAAAAALAAAVLINSRGELTAAADTLTTLNGWWVAVAVVAELISYAARGGAELVVLRQSQASGAHQPTGEHDRAPSATRQRSGSQADRPPPRPGPVVLGAATLAGDAAAYCLPFGFAASGVVTVRALGHRGVRAALATWTFTIAQMYYIGSVAVLTLIAIEIAGNRDPVPGLSAASFALVVGLLVIAVLVAVGRRWEPLRAPYRRWRMRWRRREATLRLARTPNRRTRALKRLAHWWRSQADQLSSVRMSAPAAAATFGLMIVSWLTDVAVLGLAYAALGTTPPWLGLLLAYCAGQIAAALPVTPGGLGAVEGSLTMALLAFGGTETTTLAAVLLYRLIAYWGCIPLGALAWIGLRITAVPPAPVAPASPRAALEAEPA